MKETLIDLLGMLMITAMGIAAIFLTAALKAL